MNKMSEIRKTEWTFSSTISFAACVLVAFLLLCTFTGCPVSGTLSTDNGGGVIELELGKVIVSGQLYDPAAKASIGDYGDLLKRQITSLNFFFYLQGDDQLNQSQSFFVPVENGSYYAEIMIRPGTYDIWVEAIDAYGNVLFSDNLKFEVNGGENLIEVVFIMTESYRYRFFVGELPGAYDEYGQAVITTNDGSTYYAWFSPQNPGGQDPVTMIFTAWLPLDFDSLLNQAVLAIQDINGKSYATQLDFDLFDAVYGIMYVPYVYPSWMGDVYVDISFEYEEQTTKPPTP